MRRADAARIVRARLAAQGIGSGLYRDPAAVVRGMVAMQAQDFGAAKWAVGLRSPGSTDADVERAFADRVIVRSWPMRGTLHFVAAEDLGWILSLTAPRIIAGATARRKALGLQPDDIERARAAAIAALAGGRVLSRARMHDVFERCGVTTTGQRGYHLLWHLSVTGTLCFGPPDGAAQTFALLEEWVPSPRRLSSGEAKAELALRYFRSHGPATLKDFAWWSSLGVTSAREGLRDSLGALHELVVDGISYFCDADSPPEAPITSLLPPFDEYLLGYQDRRPQLVQERADAVTPGRNGIFMPIVVHRGSVIGTWKRSISGHGVRVEPTLFEQPNAAQRRGIARAAADYARFLDRPAVH